MIFLLLDRSPSTESPSNRAKANDVVGVGSSAGPDSPVMGGIVDIVSPVSSVCPLPLSVSDDTAPMCPKIIFQGGGVKNFGDLRYDVWSPSWWQVPSCSQAASAFISSSLPGASGVMVKQFIIILICQSAEITNSYYIIQVPFNSQVIYITLITWIRFSTILNAWIISHA